MDHKEAKFALKLALFTAAALLCAGFFSAAPALAAAPDAEVEGLWLRAPDFPEDPQGSQFNKNNAGYVHYKRALENGALEFTIERFPNDDGRVTPDNIEEKFTKDFVENGGSEDGVDFDADESELAEIFKYPCASAGYTTGEGEAALTNMAIFIFTDEYYFKVTLGVAGVPAAEKYQGDFESWIKGMKFVNAEGPESEEEEGRGDLIEDEEAEKGSDKEKSEKFVAVAYTAENFGGVPWKISEPGEYDLWGGFALPNDAVCSVRVMPGYKVTLYEHSEFGGNSESFDKDADELDDWKRQASSLKVEKISGADESGAKEWLSRANEPGEFTETDLDEDDFASALKKQAKAIKKFDGLHEPHWYGETTDEERVKMGGELQKTFEALGYDVSEWTPDSFAQMMNNFFDWRKEMSAWQAACLVLNIDAEAFK